MNPFLFKCLHILLVLYGKFILHRYVVVEKENIFYFNLGAIFCKVSSLIKSNAGNKKQTKQKNVVKVVNQSFSMPAEKIWGCASCQTAPSSHAIVIYKIQNIP